MEKEGDILRRAVKLSEYTAEEIAAKSGMSRAQLYLLYKQDSISDYYKNCLKVAKIDLDKIIHLSEVKEPRAPYKNGKTAEVIEGKPNMIMVPLKAYGGFLTGYANEVFLNTLEKVNFPFIKGRCYGFEVEDYSMYKNRIIDGEIYDTGFKPGDWLACTVIEGFTWLRPGNNYVFQTVDGIVIKRFVKIENNYCYLTSINEEYNPVDPIYLKNIKVIYFVERKTTKP